MILRYLLAASKQNPGFSSHPRTQYNSGTASNTSGVSSYESIFGNEGPIRSIASSVMSVSSAAVGGLNQPVSASAAGSSSSTRRMFPQRHVQRMVNLENSVPELNFHLSSFIWIVILVSLTIVITFISFYVLAVLLHPFFFLILLFGVIYQAETSLNVIRSVNRNGRSIILTAVLGLILAYLHHLVLGYMIFRDDFLVPVDEESVQNKIIQRASNRNHEEAP